MGTPAGHRARDRALSFGSDAERYDRTRPGYPAAAIDHLLTRAGNDRPRVLDVGCGTGKLGAAFVARGLVVHGVEPDERMAAVARRHGLTVEVCPFETWTGPPAAFDLLTVGQAWHWIEPTAGLDAAARALAPGGALALVWNVIGHEPATHDALVAVYAQHAPGLVGSHTLEPADRAPGDLVALVGDHPAFTDAGDWSHAWALTLPATTWVEQLRTHSDHALLPTTQREHLLAAVSAELVARGGTITLRMTTVAITGRRR